MDHLSVLIDRYPALRVCREDIFAAYEVLKASYLQGGKLLLAGNGGSSADCEHIVGELMKGFCKERKPKEEMRRKLIAADPERGKVLAERLQGGLPAIALSGHSALTTAFLNDVAEGGVLAFAQQLYGYAKPEDVFFGISTSGNSKNVLYAAVVARALSLPVIALTGRSGGKLAAEATVAIRVPETETYRIQELHLPVYHCLCLMLEEYFFGEK